MGRLLRSFLVRWRPVLEIVRFQVNKAETEAWQTFNRVLAKELERYRRQLEVAEQQIGGLSQEIAELRFRVAEFEAAEPSRRVPQRGQPQESEQDGPDDGVRTTSDLFCCLDCSSLWLLTSPPLRAPVARRTAGPGCATCTDEPEIRLPTVKKTVTEAGLAGKVARPTDVDSPAERPEAGAKFVADLLQDGVETACAKTGAHVVREIVYDQIDDDAAKQDRTLTGAIADGLDQVPKALGRGIAWLATEIFGLPDFVGDVIGRVVAGIAFHPLHLHTVAQIARGIDIVVSDSPASANSLLEDVTVAVLKQDIAEAEMPGAVEPKSHDLPAEVPKADEPSSVEQSPYDLRKDISRQRDIDDGFGSIGSF